MAQRVADFHQAAEDASPNSGIQGPAQRGLEVPPGDVRFAGGHQLQVSQSLVYRAAQAGVGLAVGHLLGLQVIAQGVLTIHEIQGPVPLGQQGVHPFLDVVGLDQVVDALRLRDVPRQPVAVRLSGLFGQTLHERFPVATVGEAEPFFLRHHDARICRHGGQRIDHIQGIALQGLGQHSHRKAFADEGGQGEQAAVFRGQLLQSPVDEFLAAGEERVPVAVGAKLFDHQQRQSLAALPDAFGQVGIPGILGHGLAHHSRHFLRTERFQGEFGELLRGGPALATGQQGMEIGPVLAAVRPQPEDGRLAQLAQGVVQPLAGGLVCPLQIVQKDAQRLLCAGCEQADQGPGQHLDRRRSGPGGGVWLEEIAQVPGKRPHRRLFEHRRKSLQQRLQSLAQGMVRHGRAVVPAPAGQLDAAFGNGIGKAPHQRRLAGSGGTERSGLVTLSLVCHGTGMAQLRSSMEDEKNECK